MRSLKNLKLVKKNEYIDKSPSEIVKSFEAESIKAKNNGNWTAKIARYLAHCLDGGLLCS